MTNSQKQTTNTGFFLTLFSLLWEMIQAFTLGLWYFIVGMSITNFKKVENIVILVLIAINSVGLGIINYFYSWWPDFLSIPLGESLFLTKHFVSYAYYTPLFIIYYAFFGWKHQKALKQIKNGLDPLKGSNKTFPRVKKIERINTFKTKVLVEAPTHGLQDFESNKERLEASFNQMIEKIQRTNKPRYYEIFLTTKILPKRIRFEDAKDHAYKSCEFVLGESQGGMITQDIRYLPHMLIAGATGLGKSNFFKQTIMSLLRNTNHLQMHLLDLKGGLEMNEFKDLPNVNIVTTMEGALATLERIKDEMDKRFTLLARQGDNNLVPEKHKKDRIVIAVDEASVLYMKRYGQGHEAKIAQQARKITDEIAKLARAAGIHLILATQKVTKETIDTHIRENLSGRVSFKANDMEASRTVLGNAMARDLPDLPGRGIFHLGSKFTEFQAPFITKEDIQKEIKELQSLFQGKKRKVLQPELVTNSAYSGVNEEPEDF